jgi:hypothetical protein
MRRAAIVAPIRTAVGKYGGSLKSIAAGDLGAIVIKALIERTGIDPERIDDVVFSQGWRGEAPCIGRWSALAAGLPASPACSWIGAADRASGGDRCGHAHPDRRRRCGDRGRRGKHVERRILFDGPPLGRAQAPPSFTTG